VGTSSLASIHHERGRFDHWPIRDKAVLTGGRRLGEGKARKSKQTAYLTQRCALVLDPQRIHERALAC
jgi:hypothetical protein